MPPITVKCAVLREKLSESSLYGYEISTFAVALALPRKFGGGCGGRGPAGDRLYPMRLDLWGNCSSCGGNTRLYILVRISRLWYMRASIRQAR